MKMPESFRKTIKHGSFTVRVRKKPNGTYEARYRANGYNISVSSKKFNKLKAKFAEALNEYTKPTKRTAATLLDTAVTSTVEYSAPMFSEVFEQWLELKRPHIKRNTYDYYVQLYETNILPMFFARNVDAIKQSEVLQLINKYVDQGKMRTATKIYQTLKAVFEFAIGEEYVAKSPMQKIKPPVYEEQNGEAFTLQEESQFLQLLEGSKCNEEIKSALIFILYTGIRRSELASASIEGDFIRVVCAKTRKGFKEKVRFIPITPMLAKYLPGMDLLNLKNVRPDALTQAVKRLMPNHRLHELRHTFITRCQECGVPREVVSVWAGHAADNTMTSNVYTHFSLEFMLEQAKKIIYNL
ncbi:MAG: tyrosine-type recombinase/integrase family protein [Clostridia bacterium]|nr:tyrosine-type recombinase/integrase family protein [Clostridia bacterium]